MTWLGDRTRVPKKIDDRKWKELEKWVLDKRIAKYDSMQEYRVRTIHDLEKRLGTETDIMAIYYLREQLQKLKNGMW